MSLFSSSTKKSQHEQLNGGEQEAAPRSKYGIDDTLKLMRTLPVEQHADLVVLVVKNTLASMNVSLKSILTDAANKRDASVKRIAELKATIADLEEQVRAKKQEVAGAEGDLAELTKVMERLEAASHLESDGAHAGSSKPAVVSRVPPPPARSKPPTHAVPSDDERETMEVRDSAIDVDVDVRQSKVGK
jgi:molybdopterin converting factor small subunit